jgi:hypothetical protein
MVPIAPAQPLAAAMSAVLTAAGSVPAAIAAFFARRVIAS